MTEDPQLLLENALVDLLELAAEHNLDFEATLEWARLHFSKEHISHAASRE